MSRVTPHFWQTVRIGAGGTTVGIWVGGSTAANADKFSGVFLAGAGIITTGVASGIGAFSWIMSFGGGGFLSSLSCCFLAERVIREFSTGSFAFYSVIGVAAGVVNEGILALVLSQISSSCL